MASVALVQAPVNAEPEDIGIDIAWIDGDTGGLYSGWAGTHTFGGAATTMPGSVFSSFTVTANSGDSTRPDWTYELELDFNDAALIDVGDGSTFDISLVIKDDATSTPIDGYQIKNGEGVVVDSVDLGSTAGTIFFQVVVADVNLADDDRIIVQWNQIPAPGALALLGVAGLAARRRRRSA